jgi:hypothetical protein
MKIDKELINSYKEKFSKSLKDLEVKVKSIFNKNKSNTTDQTASIKSVNIKKENTSTDLNDPKVLAQKRKTQVIRFILLGLIVFFIVDMFISKKAPPAPVVTEAPTGEKQTATPKNDKEINAESLELQQKFDDSMAKELQKKQEEFKAEEESVNQELEQAKIEAKKVVDDVLARQGKEPGPVETPENNETPKIAETPTPNEPTSTPFESTEVLKTEPVEGADEEEVAEPVEEESESKEPALAPVEVVETPSPTEATKVSPDLPDTIKDETTVTPTPQTTETPSSLDSTTNSMDKIIEQVAIDAKKEKLAEIPPMPGFELKGRGLIYNCDQGYWACVTKEDYQKCETLEKWSRENKQNIKCQVSSVYESNGDCTIMQVHYINTLEAQKFCKLEP